MIAKDSKQYAVSSKQTPRAPAYCPLRTAYCLQAYTLVMAGLSDNCGSCNTEFPYALPRCPICHKSVCEACAIRMGGSTFCGTDCAHAFFFGGDDEIAELDAPGAEDGE